MIQGALETHSGSQVQLAAGPHAGCRRLRLLLEALVPLQLLSQAGQRVVWQPLCESEIAS